MVLAMPWYQRPRGVELTLRLKTADQTKRDSDRQTSPEAFQSADRSVDPKSRIECLEQSRVAEWLEQALHRALFE